MPPTWLHEVSRFFHTPRARRLVQVLDHTGCRELWLQAELALWFHDQHLAGSPVLSRVNRGDWDTNVKLPAPGTGRCDLAVRSRSGNDFELVVEIKILGGGYYTKVLTGSSATLEPIWRRISRRPDCRVAPTDRGPGGFGLLTDYHRLRRLRRVREKLLVLVVDNREDGSTTLGQALAKIQFAPPHARDEMKLSKNGVWVRMWRVEGQPRHSVGRPPATIA